jgi:sulfite reductase (NADPH) flavoprotein alpha-component
MARLLFSLPTPRSIQLAAVPKIIDRDTSLPVAGASLDAVRSVVSGFDRDQLLWSSGYLAGLAQLAAQPFATEFPAPRLDHSRELTAAARWTVFYATETGNSRRLAQKLIEMSQSSGLQIALQDLRELRPKDLAKEQNAVFVVATHGLGEAPDGTQAFFEFWLSERAPRLEQLSYSVLSLGDSSYADFCETGRLLDKRLAALGATRIVDRIDCDLDFDAPAAAWTGSIVARVKASGTGSATEQQGVQQRQFALHAVSKRQVPTRDEPFEARVLQSQKITGRGSHRDVRHVELDIAASGLQYLPGDSLGVMPQNPPQLIERVLEAIGQDGSATVTIGEESLALADALQTRKEITALSRPVLEAVSVPHPALASMLSDRGRLGEFLKTRQLIDLLGDYRRSWDAQTFVNTLRNLTPRLYSIASSLAANPGEAHLTVAVLQYRAFGRDHWGAASSLFATETESVPVYVEPNDHFRLPADGDTAIIMIGAGTGIAPYRAFMEHRREHGQRGSNWLVFGERHFSSEFLYQLEWLRFRKDGLLSSLDTAFSRDQQQKVYVQHRLLERSREVHDWLQQGAHLYVCGDAERMAGDVHAALQSIVQKEAAISADAAAQYLADLKATNRYQRDVY